VPGQKVPLGQVVQTPFWQGPFLQTLPQAPQLFGSLWGLTQVEPQPICPLGQAWQLPKQRSLGWQTVPHVPQFLVSDAKSTQVSTPLMVQWPGNSPGHWQMFWPVRFCGELAGRQVAPTGQQPHGEVKLGHWQTPFWHGKLPPQVTPQPPQLLASDCVSTQVPLQQV